MGEAEFYRGDETRRAILSGTLTSAVDMCVQVLETSIKSERTLCVDLQRSEIQPFSNSRVLGMREAERMQAGVHTAERTRLGHCRLCQSQTENNGS